MAMPFRHGLSVRSFGRRMPETHTDGSGRGLIALTIRIALTILLCTSAQFYSRPTHPLQTSETSTRLTKY